MPSPTWRFINDPPQSAAVNMATDEAIAIAYAQGKAPPTLRLYQWSAPSFSIGAFQGLSPEWLSDLENAHKQDSKNGPKKNPVKDPIVLVRRITGGRGLLHDREMTYAVIAGTEDPLFAGGIKETFYAIGMGLLAGLKALGVEAAVYRPQKKERGEGGKDPLCFASTSWYEIAAGGKKLIGSAQRRWRAHFLQQGSLAIEKSPGDFGAAVKGLISPHQITLSELLPAPPDPSRVAEALKRGFEAALDLDLRPSRLTAEEQALVQRLVSEKYGNPDWNRERRPPAGSVLHFGRDAQKSL